MLRLLLDAHLSPRVSREVSFRRPACTIVALRDFHGGAYRTSDDTDILAAAAVDGLTLVTYDLRTIVPLLKTWAEAGREHAGVILVDERTIAPPDIGGMATALAQLWDQQGDLDWRNRVVYLVRPPARPG